MDSIIEFAKETYIWSVACGAISVFITVFAGLALVKGLQAALSAEPEEEDTFGE